MTDGSPLSLAEFRQEIARFLSAESGVPEAGFGADTDFVSQGFVDSALFIMLVSHVETLMGQRIATEGFTLDAFSTPRKIFERYYLPSIASTGAPR